MKDFIIVASLMTLTMAQRPFYAGLRPGAREAAEAAALANRFGEPATTVRLPVDALGDQIFVDRISKWPVDKQPFWYINWKQIEAHRQSRPNAQNPVDSQTPSAPQGPVQQWNPSTQRSFDPRQSTFPQTSGLSQSSFVTQSSLAPRSSFDNQQSVDLQGPLTYERRWPSQQEFGYNGYRYSDWDRRNHNHNRMQIPYSEWRNSRQNRYKY